MDGLLISVTEQGVSPRPPVLFPSRSIDAIVYSSPHIYLLTRDEITIISLEDSRVSQTLRAEQIEVLCSLDGSVFISTACNLYQVHMVSIERQADALFKCGKFDEALSVYEKRLRKHFDADCMSNFIVLKKKVAFTSIEKGEYEKVADILISAEVNPEEEVFERSEEEVVSVVRRQLCPSLKALLEHGMLKKTLTQRSLPSSLGLGCFVTRNGTNSMLKLL
ncbi:hypothetical protein KIN20_033199 [Parelaphostrongylus tenuis]|uniref:CNH domain-containing protein n=1 Tax=Parelaphostrongylus tenuis TaxID=148309 RepID=A0AAD5R825_PARTN|nr:hypothetical protein KIN20_033199 [Parelaphostrongylus tenuis]